MWVSMARGLRERKKLAVRQALGSAALRLAVERGPGERHHRGHHSRGGCLALAEAIAARTGTDLEQDMYPRILAGAVIAAAQVAVTRWSAADPPAPLGPLLRRALEQLATACSQSPAGG
jgi:MftR C-terminal domain